MENKNSKARMQVIFGTLLFALILMGEFYTVIVYPQMYIAVIGFAIFGLGSLYFVVSRLFSMKEQKEHRREEQYDSIFKSEKASYLMLKKYFEDIEEKLSSLEKAAKVPTEEIVNAQKGIAKVIVNRSRENTEALLSSNELLTEQIKLILDKLEELSRTLDDNKQVIHENRDEIAKVIDAGKESILRDQQQILSTNEKALKLNNQELIVNIKDMELRINSAIMNSQKVVSQVPVMTAPLQMTSAAVNVPEEEAPLSNAGTDEIMADFGMELMDVSEPEPIPEPELIAVQLLYSGG